MTFGLLALILCGGLFGRALGGIRRLSIPIVVGEIAFGILIGSTGLGWLNTSDATAQFLYNVGFAMLMFLVGTHLPLRDPALRSALGKGLLATGISFAIGVPLAFAVAHFSGINQPALLLLLLSTSSAAVVMPIVQEKGLSGKTVLLTTTWVAVADTLTIVALPLAASTGQTLKVTTGIVAVAAAAVACYFIMRAYYNSAVGQYFRALSKERHWALDLEMSLIVLFALAAIATYFGTSILIAGFAAGAVVSIIGEPRRFSKQLLGVAEGLFVPLFFVELGAKLDFTSLIHSPGNLELTAMLAVGATIVHLVTSKLVKLPLASGLTAAAQLGVPIAVVSVGMAANILTSGQGAAIVAAALVSLISCSVGTELLARDPANVQQEPKPGDKPQED